MLSKCMVWTEYYDISRKKHEGRREEREEREGGEGEAERYKAEEEREAMQWSNEGW